MTIYRNETLLPYPVSNITDEYTITRDAVEGALVAVQDRKSVGPDESPNWLLRNCATIISIRVCSMFNSIREAERVMLPGCGNVWTSYRCGRFLDRSLLIRTSDQYL